MQRVESGVVIKTRTHAHDPVLLTQEGQRTQNSPSRSLDTLVHCGRLSTWRVYSLSLSLLSFSPLPVINHQMKTGHATAPSLWGIPADLGEMHTQAPT